MKLEPRYGSPDLYFSARADDDGKVAAPPPAAPRPAAAAAEWVRQPGVESDVTARGSCFVLTDEVRDSTAAVGVDERRAAEQQRVDALALSAATTPLAAQRESPEQVSARHAVAVRAHGLAAVATASPEVDRTVPEALVVPGLETIPIVLIQATDDDPEVVAWFTGGRAPTHLRSVYGCPMEWVHAARGWDKLRRGWFYVSVNGRGARYQIFEHYGLGLAATTRLSTAPHTSSQYLLCTACLPFSLSSCASLSCMTVVISFSFCCRHVRHVRHCLLLVMYAITGMGREMPLSWCGWETLPPPAVVCLTRQRRCTGGRRWGSRV